MTQVEEDRFGRFRSCLVCGWLEEVSYPLGEWELVDLPEEVWQRLAQLLEGQAVGVEGDGQGKGWEEQVAGRDHSRGSCGGGSRGGGGRPRAQALPGRGRSRGI